METPRFIVNLGAIQLGELDELVRIPLLKLGRWVKGTLKFAITAADIPVLRANFSKRANGQLVIDYEHASERPEVARGEGVPAAGWLHEIEERPDAQGILWGLAAFTTNARRRIQAGEYKFLSPALNWSVRDKETGAQQGLTLTSAALTNRPFFDMLPAVQLSEDGWTQQGKETNVVKTIALADRAAGTVRVVLDDGKEETLAVEGLVQPKVIKLSEIQRKEGKLDFPSLQCAEGTLIDGAVWHAMLAQTEIDEAVKAGKILPAQRPAMEKLALSDIEAFREFVKSQKAQVDLSERGFAGDGQVLSTLDKVDTRIEDLTNEKLKADPKLAYRDAVRLVLTEHPELEQRRKELMASEAAPRQ